HAPWGALVLFKKKDGSFRLCIDDRELDKSATKNLPRINDLFDQLRVHGEDILKTTFRTRYGHFEFTVMHFEVNQCTSGFHRLDESGVQVVFRQVFFFLFIDDILVYSKSKEDHEVHLKLVLELLKKEKLFA
nr:putative reverse transcriptase domain-containing protein [Tanacetum cinerariifolium]